jgi:hypothetical protein
VWQTQSRIGLWSQLASVAAKIELFAIFRQSRLMRKPIPIGRLTPPQRTIPVVIPDRPVKRPALQSRAKKGKGRKRNLHFANNYRHPKNSENRPLFRFRPSNSPGKISLRCHNATGGRFLLWRRARRPARKIQTLARKIQMACRSPRMTRPLAILILILKASRPASRLFLVALTGLRRVTPIVTLRARSARHQPRFSLSEIAYLAYSIVFSVCRSDLRVASKTPGVADPSC